MLTLEFSTASDIWSFGVCLWEILCFGRQIPFQSYNNAQVVDLIIAGRLLDRPSYFDCEPTFYALMLNCWRELPVERCSFKELTQKLTQLINNCTTTNNIQSSSSHNNWLVNNNSTRNTNRVCSPLPSQQNRTTSIKQFQFNGAVGEDKVNGWLFNSNEFNGSTNYLQNSNASKNTALKTNTMNSSSTYASSYQPSSPNYNLINNNSTANSNQVEYDQPFVQINDLEKNHKLIKSSQQPALSTFQSKPRNGLTIGLKHLELKNSHHLINSKLDNKQDFHHEHHENHYSKLTYENEDAESQSVSSIFNLI